MLPDFHFVHRSILCLCITPLIFLCTFCHHVCKRLNSQEEMKIKHTQGLGTDTAPSDFGDSENCGFRCLVPCTESQKHGAVEVGKDLQGSSGPTALLTQGHLELVGQNLSQRLLNISMDGGSTTSPGNSVCQAQGAVWGSMALLHFSLHLTSSW